MWSELGDCTLYGRLLGRRLLVQCVPQRIESDSMNPCKGSMNS